MAAKAGFEALAPAQAPIQADAQAIVAALTALRDDLAKAKVPVDGPYAIDCSPAFGAGGWLAAGSVMVLAVQPLPLADARPSASGTDESAAGAAKASLVALAQSRSIRIISGPMSGLSVRLNVGYPAGSRPVTAAEVAARAERMQRRASAR